MSIADDDVFKDDWIQEDPAHYARIVPLVNTRRVAWHDHDLDII